MINAHNALQPAHHALQSGDRETAKRLLAAVLRADPQNVRAWQWMSEAADTTEQKRECLLRVLAIEPDNQAARAGLSRLARQASSSTDDRSHDADQGSAPLATNRQHIAIERDWQVAATPAEALDPAQRSKAERYVRLAGGLSLTLLLGLALLVFALIRVIPKASAPSGQPSERAIHTATLWCPSCEREGQPVVLSTRIGASVYRGVRASGLPHGTRVSVLRYRWSTLERRYYALVAAEGKRGWVPETQIRR